MEQEQKSNTNTLNKNNDLDMERLWAIIAYIFFPIPLIFTKHRTKFLNYHINQSIILFIISLIGQTIFKVLPNFLFWIPSYIFSALIVVLFIIGIINVIKKEIKPLPLIGELFSFLK